MIKILDAQAEFIREPLLGAFGFKGHHVDELWQVVVKLRSENYSATGVAVQSVLWSDANIFAQNCPSGGNALMFSMTNFAIKLACGFTFESPEELLDYLLPKVLDYGKMISGSNDMRTTFALNSLVAVDFAAWILFAKENKLKTFDDIIPPYAKKAMNYKNEMLSRIPLVTYGLDKTAVSSIIDNKDFFLKIKIGSDPDGDNNKKKMVEWDKKRIEFIHNIAKDIYTPYMQSGHIPYYLDANGRYDSKERLMELLDYLKKIGALERIILLEEPFDELNEIDVHDIPVRVAADESVHSTKDAISQIEMGYTALALKPIAKTLSMSFRILKEAHDRNIPCFCADLTVNPVMVEWNKNFAARITPLPRMKIGVLETNGYQNYKNWDTMLSYHPMANAEFTQVRDGVYHLGKDFYETDSGLFTDSKYYSKLGR